jgi:hypothetical protein
MIVPGEAAYEVAVLAERRPGVTAWQDWSWRAVEVLEDAPDAPPWTVLREDAGRTLYLAGWAVVRLFPTDTSNYKHNLEAAEPRIWVVLREAEAPPGMVLQLVTVDPAEAHLHADVGSDLVESLPLPPGLRAAAEAFVAAHHKERGFWKRRRDRADPEALARRPGGGAEE